MAALLAALSAATFGVGDFFGGLSARRIAAVLTTLVAQATGLVLILALSILVSGDPTGTDLVLGAAAGLCGAVGLILFYWAMAQGPMSVVAPVSAVMSAVVPIVAGMAQGDRPSAVAFVGIALGLPAIVLIAREPTTAEADASTVAVEDSLHVHTAPRLARLGGLPIVAAGLAGVGFGAFFTLLSHSSDGSGLWPIAAARTSAVLLALVVVIGASPARPAATGIVLAMVAGCLDGLGNAFYLFATRHGLLTLVGVIGALYPASTVLLARVVLRERIAAHQWVGLCLAAAAVGFIARG